MIDSNACIKASSSSKYISNVRLTLTNLPNKPKAKHELCRPSNKTCQTQNFLRKHRS